MIKKILLLFIAITIISISINTYAVKLPETIDQALQMANAELRESLGLNYDYFEKKNANGKEINEELAIGSWSGMAGLKGVGTDSVLVYGQPTELNASVNRHRYLGETIGGDKFTNMFFPNDAWGGGYLEDRNWIKNPWNNKKTEANAQDTTFDAKNISDKYLPNIIAGIESYYKDVLKGSYKTKDWHNYVHVLQPPTKYAWGMGRMWHQTQNGSVWYITIPLAPYEAIKGTTPVTPQVPEQDPIIPSEPDVTPVENNKFNLKAEIIESPNQLYEGQVATVKAKVICTGAAAAFATKAAWYVDGAIVASNDNFIIKTERESEYSFEVPHGGANVKFVVNYKHDAPEKEVDPPGFTDNEAWVSIDAIHAGTSNGGTITVKITKNDGIDKLAYHPQTPMIAKFGYTYGEVFELGNIDKSCFPGLNLNKVFDYNYYTNTLIKNARKYKVTVTYNWKTTYHKERKIVGRTSTGEPIYAWVDVPDPAPTAEVTLNTTEDGRVFNGQIDFNGTSGENANFYRERKQGSHKETFSIDGHQSTTFEYIMPCYSTANTPDDSAILKALVTVNDYTETKRCSCGYVARYTRPSGGSETKTIVIKAGIGMPINVRQSE